MRSLPCRVESLLARRPRRLERTMPRGQEVLLNVPGSRQLAASNIPSLCLNLRAAFFSFDGSTISSCFSGTQEWADSYAPGAAIGFREIVQRQSTIRLDANQKAHDGPPIIFEPRTPFDIHYDEGLKVGYKWYDSENKQPLFPFGHGLSNTTYAYSDLHAIGAKSLSVTLTVQNTGQRAGSEIAQVYLSFPKNAGEPAKRLIAWRKIPLQAGESKTIAKCRPALPLYIQPDTDRRQNLTGDYKVMAGPSSAALPLTSTITLEEISSPSALWSEKGALFTAWKVYPWSHPGSSAGNRSFCLTDGRFR